MKSDVEWQLWKMTLNDNYEKWRWATRKHVNRSMLDFDVLYMKKRKFMHISIFKYSSIHNTVTHLHDIIFKGKVFYLIWFCLFFNNTIHTFINTIIWFILSMTVIWYQTISGRMCQKSRTKGLMYMKNWYEW